MAPAADADSSGGGAFHEAALTGAQKNERPLQMQSVSCDGSACRCNVALLWCLCINARHVSQAR